MENEKQQYDNAALRQQLGQYFAPAPNWPNCEMPLLKNEMWQKVFELLPGYFEDYNRLQAILLSLGFQYSFNEHNGKYYWLVNPQNNTVVY